MNHKELHIFLPLQNGPRSKMALGTTDRHPLLDHSKAISSSRSFTAWGFGDLLLALRFPHTPVTSGHGRWILWKFLHDRQERREKLQALGICASHDELTTLIQKVALCMEGAFERHAGHLS